MQYSRDHYKYINLIPGAESAPGHENIRGFRYSIVHGKYCIAPYYIGPYALDVYIKSFAGLENLVRLALSIILHQKGIYSIRW